MEPKKKAVLSAVRRLSQPLARLLLEAGIGAGEFQSLMKASFVHAADELGDTARPNTSRIATMTGLTRREVAALLRTTEEDVPDGTRGYHRIQRVLTGWWTDSDFQDDSGQPAPLSIRGTKLSFTSLVKRYSVEPRVVTILDELVRVKAVRRRADGKFEAISRHFANAGWDPQGIAALGEQIRDHLNTLHHNLTSPTQPRFHRVIQNGRLNPAYVPMLTRDIAAQTDALADSLEDALNDPGAASNATGTAVRLGVGFYVFEAPAETVIAPRVTKPKKRSRKR